MRNRETGREECWHCSSSEHDTSGCDFLQSQRGLTVSGDGSHNVGSSGSLQRLTLVTPRSKLPSDTKLDTLIVMLERVDLTREEKRDAIREWLIYL